MCVFTCGGQTSFGSQFSSVVLRLLLSQMPQAKDFELVGNGPPVSALLSSTSSLSSALPRHVLSLVPFPADQIHYLIVYRRSSFIF